MEGRTISRTNLSKNGFSEALHPSEEQETSKTTFYNDQPRNSSLDKLMKYLISNLGPTSQLNPLLALPVTDYASAIYFQPDQYLKDV